MTQAETETQQEVGLRTHQFDLVEENLRDLQDLLTQRAAKTTDADSQPTDEEVAAQSDDYIDLLSGFLDEDEEEDAPDLVATDEEEAEEETAQAGFVVDEEVFNLEEDEEIVVQATDEEEEAVAAEEISEVETAQAEFEIDEAVFNLDDDEDEDAPEEESAAGETTGFVIDEAVFDLSDEDDETPEIPEEILAELTLEQRNFLTEAIAKLTPEEIQEAVAEQVKLAKDVPWQTALLTGSKPLAKAAVGMLLRKKAKGAITLGLAQIMGSGLAVSGGAAVVAVARDAITLRKGSGALYERSVQHTWAALTTLTGEERTGSESAREHEKNKIDLERKRSIPLKLLRKVGAVFNAPRSYIIKKSFGITRDRSKISQEISNIAYDLTATDEQIEAAIIAAYKSKKLSKRTLLSLGNRLARLRSMGNYGDIDVHGETGDRRNKVDAAHNPEVMARFHAILNKLVQEGKIAVDGEPNHPDTLSEKAIKKWKDEFEDEQRLFKDKKRKLAAILGTGATTFATVGMTYAIPWLAEKADQLDIEEIKKNYLTPLYEGFKETIEGTKFDIDIDFSGYFDGVREDWNEGVDKVKDFFGVDQTQASEGGETSGEYSEANSHGSIDTQPEENLPITSNNDTPIENESVGYDPSKNPDLQPNTASTPELNSTGGVLPQSETLNVPLAEDQIDILNLGQDEVPWNAILHTVQDSHVQNPMGTTNVIKNLYKALNHNLPTGVIGPDSGFAILPDSDIPTDLPEGAVAYFFDDDQIENLSGHIDEAISTWKAGGELTSMQENLVQLNGGNLTFEELASDKELLQQMLKLANEG